MSLINALTNEERACIELLCTIHIATRNYLLYAEECAEKGELFLQPLKEHRDAYEHLMRCYSISLLKNEHTQEYQQKYIHENINKALGHEYRAFFDTADWLTYILRRGLRERLQQCGEDKCNVLFDNYAEIKDFINALPAEIAQLRAEKDIGNANAENSDVTEKVIVSGVKRYQQILDKLIALQKETAKKLPL